MLPEVQPTVDQNIRNKHPLDRLSVAVLELDTRDSRPPALEEMSPHFGAFLVATRTHRVVSLANDGWLDRRAERA